MIKIKPASYSQGQHSFILEEYLKKAPEQKSNNKEAYQGYVLEFLIIDSNRAVGTLYELREHFKQDEYEIHCLDKKIKVRYKNGKFEVFKTNRIPRVCTSNTNYRNNNSVNGS